MAKQTQSIKSVADKAAGNPKNSKKRIPPKAKAKREEPPVHVTVQPQQPRSIIVIPPNQQFEKATEQLNKSVSDMNSFFRESMEIAAKSAAAMTKGWDETIRSATALTQEHFTRLLTASKTIMSAKSPREALELQAEHLKGSFESIVANTGKLSEISSRVFKETVEPVSQHANNTISRLMDKSKAA